MHTTSISLCSPPNRLQSQIYDGVFLSTQGFYPADTCDRPLFCPIASKVNFTTIITGLRLLLLLLLALELLPPLLLLLLVSGE